MSHTRSAAMVAALVLAAAVAGGCAPRGPRPAPPEAMAAGARCAGQPYLEVRNGLETAVEVYAYAANIGARRYLGSVAPGSERLAVAEEVGHVYAEVGGRRVTAREAAPGTAGGVTFTRGCTSAGGGG